MATTDYRDVLSYYTNFSPGRDTRADEAQGEKDGEFEQPPSGQITLSAYEWKILAQGRFDYARFQTQTQIDRRLSAAASQGRKQQRYDEFGSSLKDLSYRQDAEISALNKEKGSNSARARTEDDELLEAQHRYDDMRALLEREPDLHFSGTFWGIKAYFWLMSLFALVEMIVNPRPFEHAIGSDHVFLTYFGVFSFSVGVVLSAHFVGMVLRQRKWRLQQGDIMRLRYGLPLIILMVLGAFTVVTWRRYNMDLQLRGGEVEALGRALVPFVINIVLFVASSAVAFFSHDPHPDYEALMLARNAAQQRVQKRLLEYSSEVAAIEFRYRRRRHSLGSRAERLQRDIDEKLAESGALDHREDAELVKIITVIGQRLLAYQDGNERMRRTIRPEYFGQRTLDIVENYLRGRPLRLADEDDAPMMAPEYST